MFPAGADRDFFKRPSKMRDASVKLAQWRLRLYKLELHVVPQAQIKHQASDVLSRLATATSDKSELHDKFPLVDINPEKLRTFFRVRIK